jgi:hypothetical protein
MLMRSSAGSANRLSGQPSRRERLATLARRTIAIGLAAETVALHSIVVARAPHSAAEVCVALLAT